MRVARSVTHEGEFVFSPDGSTIQFVTEQWTFLTNHAHVLVLLDRDPDMRMRDLAREVGLTERATQRIISELVESGYLTRRRQGRRNTYTLHGDQPLRHPLESSHTVDELLRAVGGD
jgi:DNA-binding MarR family transcriptional regulator